MGWCDEQVKMEMLGTADRVVVLKEMTTIVSDGRNQEAVEARIAMIRKEKEEADTQVGLTAKRQPEKQANNDRTVAR